MSKPPATKLSTPLSESSWSVNILCGHNYFPELPWLSWARILPEVHRLPLDSFLQSWRTFETLCSATFCKRMPQRCSTWFRSGDILGQSITFTLSLFNKTAVILEVFLASLSCWNIAMWPCILKEGGIHALPQYFTVHMFTVHSSMKCNFPTPAALMQPQTMAFPPPCLTVGMTHFSLYFSTNCCHTCLRSSEPNKTFWSHQTIGQGSSNPCPLWTCPRQTVCGLYLQTSEKDFFCDRHTD